MAIDIIARGMIEESSGDISQLSEKVSNHTGNSDIHVTTTDKSNWNGYANEIETNKTDISQLFDITKGGADVGGESSYTLKNAVDYPLLGLNLYGKSTQDGTPTPDAPVDIVSVGDGGSVEITACGKNLVNPTEITVGGFAYETGAELNNNPARARTGYIAVTPAYLVGIVPDGYSILSIYNYAATKEFLGIGGVSLLKGQNGFIRLLLKRNDGAAITNDDLNTLKSTLIVTNGESVDYEPYQGSTASITSALPLCGIPVESGGNYTDKDGQQWVCDELIYNADGTGKVIKRAAKVVFDGSGDEKWVTTSTLSSDNGTSNKLRFRTLMFRENENLNLKPIKPLTTETLPKLICDRYATKSSTSTYCSNTGICVDATSADIVIYDDDYAESTVDEWKSYLAANPITVVYQLETPQEIELTAAEITALRQVQTFNGITNISNDGGADMGVTYCTNKTLSEYVMPITTGLQAQIDELKAAVLSLGGNV